MDDEPFNPDYVEVDRVLDVSESTDENGEVLWSLSLGLSLSLFFFLYTHTHQSALCFMCADGDLISGEVVQSALRRLHLGAEGRHRPVQDRRIWAYRSTHAQH